MVGHKDEVVISGIGGVFPKCNNVDELTSLLFNNINAVTIDSKRWNPSIKNQFLLFYHNHLLFKPWFLKYLICCNCNKNCQKNMIFLVFFIHYNYDKLILKEIFFLIKIIKTFIFVFRLHFTGYKIRIYYSVSLLVRKLFIISMTFMYRVCSTENVPYNSIIIDTKVIIIELYYSLYEILNF